MQEGRIVSERRQANCREKFQTEFQYPFGCINDGYSGYEMQMSDELPGEPVLPVNGFPKNIREWLWASPGSNDEAPWWLLGSLESGVYFFYDAWCDYTGFDCQGHMSIYASEKLETLIVKAMSEAAYGQYIRETS
jgi:hypothetical protein